MSDAEKNDKTQLRADLELDLSLPDSTSATAATLVAADTPLSLPPENATQLTRYSASDNYSAGFAQARELLKQSQVKKGVLLKKRFLLEEILGHGGMGTVYKARDLRKVEAEDPNPYIAAKVLNQDFRDHPDAFITLQQETAKSQTLAHPNIVTVHDFDRDGDTLYMTMELLEGKPLDHLIQQNKNKGMDKALVWSITYDLCAALSYAHQRQLIHADFKPGNIFVMSDGHAKVLDFGIARAASKEAQKHKFDAGQLGALTPAYATIEMLNDEPISFADDVYALACVVYEMLAGRHPYGHRSALDALAKDIKPSRPSGLTNAEWKALQHALALKKKDRFLSIEQFSAALFPKKMSIGFKLVLVSAVVMSLGGAWFGYQQYQTQLDLQQKFQDKMTSAKNCLAQQNYECAVAASLVAVNLNPDSLEAKALLKQSQEAESLNQKNTQIRRLLKEATACEKAGDVACVQVKSREILSLDAKHAQGLELAATASKMQDANTIQSWLAEGQKCLSAADLPCARMFLEKAQTVDKSSEEVASFAASLILEENKQAKAHQEQEAENEKALLMANKCLSQNNYACVFSQVNPILQREPNHPDALVLKQKAELAEVQQREANQKVRKLLSESDTCMLKKNYACAIAKAEAALDLAPSNMEAQAKKRKATETQQRLKESGFNIR